MPCLTYRMDNTLRLSNGMVVEDYGKMAKQLVKNTGMSFDEARDRVIQKSPVLKKFGRDEYIRQNGRPDQYVNISPRMKQEMVQNALGYEVAITTLTAIMSKITEQSFYQIPISDYIRIIPEEGAFSTQLVTFRKFSASEPFETGILKRGSNGVRMPSVDVAIDPVITPTHQWAKKLSYNLFDVNFAARSGVWDYVKELETTRYEQWQLGIQEMVFLGVNDAISTGGLLNQSQIPVNTTLITQYINAMDPVQLSEFLGQMLSIYRKQNGGTAYPDTFIVPELDYNGMINPASAIFTNGISKLALIEEAMRQATHNRNFAILPCFYADQAVNGLTSRVNPINKNVYMLTKRDERSLKINIPVNYTTTMQNSADSFNYESVGYGQFTEPTLLKPLEHLYFTWSA